ncbi:MAG: cupin domain-containing protein [Devosia sp.]
MPRIDNSTTTTFDIIPGVHFTPVASPSRGTSETAIWRARVLPHMIGVVHHMTREEIVVAISGSGVVTIGDESHALQPGDAFAVPAFTDFRLECAGDVPFEAMVVLPVGGRAIVGTEPSFAPPWSL